MSNKVPQIRFNGYSDAWVQRKLGELMDVSSVKRIHQSDWTSSGVPFYRARDIVAKAKGKEIEEPIYISQDKYDEYSAVSGKVQPGDLLVTGVGTIGIPLLIDGREPLYFKDGNIIWFKNHHAIDGSFFFHQFRSQRVQKFIKDVAGIGTVGTYTIDSGKKTPFNLPVDEAEQQKVGLFFDELDNLIAANQRKLDLLKEQKKGYLQKMFPKNGAKVPELRFAGFADDWEERQLSDIADRFDNLRVPITASDRKSGDTPYYGANGIQDYVEGFTHDGEFILVAEDGANDLKNYPVQYVNGKVWVNNHAHVLQGKKTTTDNKFLMNSIKNFNIEPFLVGGGRAKLNADVMMKLNVLLPTFEEQEKIGSFFKQLDDTITLHQRKLDLLKEQKKGFLQKMFV